MRILRTTLFSCFLLAMPTSFFAQDELAVLDENPVSSSLQIEPVNNLEPAGEIDEACSAVPQAESANFFESLFQNWLTEGLIVSGVLLGYFFFRKKLEYGEEGE